MIAAGQQRRHLATFKRALSSLAIFVALWLFRPGPPSLPRAFSAPLTIETIEGLTVWLLWLVGALLALSLIRPEALGMGDVKLALLLVLGLDGRAVVALLVALALAAGFGLLMLVRFGRSAASRKLPLAPFFAAGALIALIA